MPPNYKSTSKCPLKSEPSQLKDGTTTTPYLINCTETPSDSNIIEKKAQFFY